MKEPSTKTLAEWTRNERVVYLATEIMGWTLESYETGKEFYAWTDESKENRHSWNWNPYEDHNDAHMVEKRVIENSRHANTLWDDPHAMQSYLYAELPERMDAVIASHQSLPTL